MKQAGFVPMVFAAVLVLLGVFALVGGFGSGGPLPVAVFNGLYSAFGRAAYPACIAVAYFGLLKFKSSEHRLPLARVLTVSFMIVAFAGLMHLLTIVDDGNQTGTWIEGKGGTVGSIFGGLLVGVLSRPLAIITIGVISLFSVFLTFAISPKVLLKLGILLPRKPKFGKDGDDYDGDGETVGASGKRGLLAPVKDLALLKERISRTTNFKLNEGVPVESHGEEKHQKGLSTLRNTAQKLAPTEVHEALTVANDPDWKIPTIDMLNQKQDKADAGDVNGNAKIIEETFQNFNIDVEMLGANIGPRVTQYTLSPPSNVKLSKMVGLETNLALNLAATSIRIEAPIPGQRAVGIEVPNVKGATVRVASIFQSTEWKTHPAILPVALGRDIAGKPSIVSLEKAPHLLIAGQTGSGKSVMINVLLTSLLYKNSPSQLKLILVDPKQVEMAPYNDMPHLLTPVIVEPEKCISALKWAVAEMERRYTQLAEHGKRNIAEYNKQNPDESMPYIVIVIDELADLMMLAARDVEALIVRIAQKARAVGIHLVLATQRPSVDVITGLIKANVPARIAFTVASQIDSRTIIDQMGAEKLLGMGDLLYQTSDMPKPRRVQGALITDDETNKLVDFIKMQRPPDYNVEIISQAVQIGSRGGGVVMDTDSGSDDAVYRDAVQVVVEAGKASTSLLQRRLRVGYSRASRLIDEMEENGIVGPADGARPREVMITSVEQAFNKPIDHTAPMTDSSELDF
jgi:DNA segregation ATPase FtsK/SpoIIIE, S-DNA-T family